MLAYMRDAINRAERMALGGQTAVLILDNEKEGKAELLRIDGQVDFAEEFGRLAETGAVPAFTILPNASRFISSFRIADLVGVLNDSITG